MMIRIDEGKTNFVLRQIFRPTRLPGLTLVLAVSWLTATGQFRDEFAEGTVTLDPSANQGWACHAGDGQATVDLLPGDGYATVIVDATNDQRNLWWAIIRRRVSDDMDLATLQPSGFELRLEARIRVSDAPRRVNLHFNTQRTTDFHSHLMEFDIPTPGEWHTISMTTEDFDAKPGDQVFAQMALMDWGRGQYRVDVDYLRVDVVDVALAGPDQGAAVPYHPPVPDLDTFSHRIPAAQAAMIEAGNPETNFNDWTAVENGANTRVLSVNGAQMIILRWDPISWAGKTVDGAGVLELTTHSLQRPGERIKDFGLIRVVEILGGDPRWDQASVTFDSFVRSEPLDQVLNPQMIIDLEVNEARDGQTLATISNPVLQRLLDGRTHGIAILPLGSIHASFFARNNGTTVPTLHLNLRDH